MHVFKMQQLATSSFAIVDCAPTFCVNRPPLHFLPFITTLTMNANWSSSPWERKWNGSSSWEQGDSPWESNEDKDWTTQMDCTIGGSVSKSALRPELRVVLIQMGVRSWMDGQKPPVDVPVPSYLRMIGWNPEVMQPVCSSSLNLISETAHFKSSCNSVLIAFFSISVFSKRFRAKRIYHFQSVFCIVFYAFFTRFKLVKNCCVSFF